MNLDEAIIFDLDGTITHTLNLAIEGSKEALRQVLNQEYSNDEITRHFGKTEEAIFHAYCGPRWRDGLACYADYFEKNTSDAVIFPGMKDVLKYLKDSKIKTALVTGRGPVTTDIILRKTGIKDYFEHIKTGSSEKSIKTQCMKEVLELWRQPASKTYYIGDIANDVKDAKAAGVNPLSATWFKNASWEELIAAGPLKIFNTVAEFAYWVKNK